MIRFTFVKIIIVLSTIISLMLIFQSKGTSQEGVPHYDFGKKSGHRIEHICPPESNDYECPPNPMHSSGFKENPNQMAVIDLGTHAGFLLTIYSESFKEPLRLVSFHKHLQVLSRGEAYFPNPFTVTPRLREKNTDSYYVDAFIPEIMPTPPADMVLVLELINLDRKNNILMTIKDIELRLHSR